MLRILTRCLLIIGTSVLSPGSSGATPQNTSAQSVPLTAQHVKTVQFPADRSLGLLYFAPLRNQPDQDVNWFGPEFVLLGAAQGVVNLPTNALVRLDVSKDACQDLSPLSRIPPDSIQGLYFNINTDPADQFEHIGKLTGLKFLHFRSVPLTDGRILKLANLTNLEYLSCSVYGHQESETVVNDRALMVIARFQKLKNLDLRSNPITDDGLRHLKSLHQLEVLILDATKVSGSGIVYLKELPKLNTISFGSYQDGAPIDDDGLEVICQLPQLTRLILNGTDITDEGLKHLSAIEGLEELSLDHTRVTESGLASLIGMKRLRSLGFQKTMPPPQGRSSLGDKAAELLSQIPTLEEVSGSWRLTQTGFENLAKMKNLKSLNFREHVTDEQLDYVAQLPSLEYLALHHCPVTDFGIQKIAQLPLLKTLVVDQCDVSGACFGALRDAPALQNLTVGINSLGPENNWVALGKLTELNSLNIYVPEISSTACRELAKLPNLKSLDTGVSRMGPEFFEALKSLPRLQNLQFNMGDVSLDAWKTLAELQNLEYLGVYGEINEDQLMALADLPSLRIFQNDSQKLNEEIIGRFLKKSKSLQSFFHPSIR